MTVKMNGKPIRVTKEEDKNKVDWVYVSGYGLICMFILYFVDSLSLSFGAGHIFPWMKIVWEVMSWFGMFF